MMALYAAGVLLLVIFSITAVEVHLYRKGGDDE